MSEPELVFDSVSVSVWHSPKFADAAEIWIVFNGLGISRLTMGEFLRRRGAAGYHIVSKQDHWYRGRDMAEVLRVLNARTQATRARIILSGTSMGGFGALLYSPDLRCDLVVVSAPQVVVDDDLSVGHDDCYRSKWKALETPEWLPWHDASARCTRAAPIRLIYDPHTQEDRWHASFLRRLPNVSLWQAPFAGHEVPLELRRGDIWIPALQAVLADDRPAWHALMRRFRADRDRRFPYHWALGQRHFKSGRFDHAARHFRRAIEVRPTSHESYMGLALALRDGGSVSQAVDALESAIPHLGGDARYWWIYQGIANLNLEAGRNGPALNAVLRGKAMFPESSELEAEHAKVRLRTAKTSADLSAAAKLAERAFALDPASRERARLLVHIHACRSRYLIDRGHSPAIVAASKQKRRRETRRVTASAMALIEAHGADPEDVPLLIDIADVHEALGDRSGAIAALRTAADQAELGKDGWLMLHRLAALYARAGDFAAAEAALVEATHRFAGVAETHLELGKLRIEPSRPHADPAAAARSFRRALAIEPGHPAGLALRDQANQMRAKRLIAEGRPSAAARVHQLLVVAEPENASRHADLANALEATGKLGEAVTAWRAAAALVQDDPAGWWPYHHIAALWARNGDLAATGAAIAEAADKFPAQAEAVAELGKFMFEKDPPDFREAARLLRRAIVLAPEDDRPRDLLRRCREGARRAGKPIDLADRLRMLFRR